MPSNHALGDYLRARRELTKPGDVGIATGAGIRRVPGLRRSEVALLAGISAEYYVKLEQGQGTNPTAQVLDALSRALRLDAAGRDYLHALARASDKPEQATAPGANARTRWLIDSWPMTAALIHDRHNDIVASNALMRALIPAYREGANSLTSLLLDPAMRDLYPDWDGLTARSVALLRTTSGLHPEHPRAKQLVAQLSRGSARFREVWARNDVLRVSEGTHTLVHPKVGALSLHFAILPLSTTDGLTIFLYYAEPGTPNHDRLSALARGE